MIYTATKGILLIQFMALNSFVIELFVTYSSGFILIIYMYG